jgi:hypothetical protein
MGLIISMFAFRLQPFLILGALIVIIYYYELLDAEISGRDHRDRSRRTQLYTDRRTTSFI